MRLVRVVGEGVVYGLQFTVYGLQLRGLVVGGFTDKQLMNVNYGDKDKIHI